MWSVFVSTKLWPAVPSTVSLKSCSNILSGGLEQINPLFVAEKLCDVHQSDACVSKNIADCKLWPNPDIKLPNVTESMREIINGLEYLSCIPQTK